LSYRIAGEGRNHQYRFIYANGDGVYETPLIAMIIAEVVSNPYEMLKLVYHGDFKNLKIKGKL
jgi:hypothetical protein